jgi:hypothetical protein
MALLYALPIIPRDRAAAGKAGRLGDSAGTPLQVAGLFVFYCGAQCARRVAAPAAPPRG